MLCSCSAHWLADSDCDVLTDSTYVYLLCCSGSDLFVNVFSSSETSIQESSSATSAPLSLSEEAAVGGETAGVTVTDATESGVTAKAVTAKERTAQQKQRRPGATAATTAAAAIEGML
jgi:hypothetical protein